MIAIVALISAASFGLYAYFQERTFNAELTFMVNSEDSGGSMGGVTSLLGQFGLGGGGGGEYNLDKIVALGKSRRIIQRVLLDSALIGEKDDLIANHLIQRYDFHEEWKDADNAELHGFLFTTGDPAAFDRTANGVVKSLYSFMIGNPSKGEEGLMRLDYEEETGILRLRVQSLKESLSIIICEKLYEALSEFYILQSTEKQRFTYNKLQAKVDSLRNELNATEYRLARFQDQSMNVFRRQELLEQSRLARESQILTIMYGEAIKNLETANFLLKDATPFSSPSTCQSRRFCRPDRKSVV